MVFKPRQHPVLPHGAASVRRDGRDGEKGFVLLAVLFLMVLILLSLAVAAPKVAVELQREKEQETIHRGMQYARAIREYHMQFGSYPSSIDQLMKTNNRR